MQQCVCTTQIVFSGEVVLRNLLDGVTMHADCTLPHAWQTSAHACILAQNAYTTEWRYNVISLQHASCHVGSCSQQNRTVLQIRCLKLLRWLSSC